MTSPGRRREAPLAASDTKGRGTLQAARKSAQRPREQRACTADLKREVDRLVHPPTPAWPSMDVPTIAARAGLSTRTIYRILEDDPEPTKQLDVADRVMYAIDRPLHRIRFVDNPEDCSCDS